MVHQAGMNTRKPKPKQASRDFSKIGRVAGFAKTRRQPPDRLHSTDLQRLETADTKFAQDRETFAERQVRLQHKFPSLFQEYPPTH